MKKRFKFKLARGLARVSLTRPEPMAWLGAAYVLTGEAYVELGDEFVLLRPKKGRVEPLATRFTEEYDNQLRLWALAQQNRDMRAEILRRALVLADEAPAGAAQAGLSAEQKEEIARLLGEASPVKDPLGITVPWDKL